MDDLYLVSEWAALGTANHYLNEHRDDAPVIVCLFLLLISMRKIRILVVHRFLDLAKDLNTCIVVELDTWI